MKVKAVLIGDSGVGKTCLYDRIGNSVYDDGHVPTVGGSFRAVSMQNKPGDTFEIRLWDTAGQERFRTLIPMYFERTPILLFVYSITDSESLTHLSEWYDLAAQRSEPDAKVFILGNKSDLEDQRSVACDALEAAAKKMDAFITLDVSAKSSMGIDDLVAGILKACEGFKKVEEPATPLSLRAADADAGRKKPRGCC
jgi:small GTP-binding protein